MGEHVLTDEDATSYIEAGVTAAELVLLRWPDMTAEQADWVLWERTPFPLIPLSVGPVLFNIYDEAHRTAAEPPTPPGDAAGVAEGGAE